MLGGALVAGAAVGSTAWAIFGRSSSVFGPSVWRGPKDRREIALTFDDGPTKGPTDAILDILGELGVKATFFVIGRKPSGAVGGGKDLTSLLVSLGDEAASHSGALLKMFQTVVRMVSSNTSSARHSATPASCVGAQ